MSLVLICCVMGGILSGVMGIGGGAIIIPVLTVVGDFSWHEAYSLSLFSIIASSLWVSYRKLSKDLVCDEWAVSIESIGCLAALVGSTVALITSGLFATEILLAISTVFAFQSMWRSIHRTPDVPMSVNSVDLEDPRSINPLSKIGLSSACGFVSGLLGIGGGLVVMACSPLMRLSMHVATATSSYAMGFMAMGALLVTVVSGQMVWDHALIAFIGTVWGSVIGVQLAQKISESRLKLIFACLLVSYTIFMWYRYAVMD